MHLINVYLNAECIVKSANSYKYMLYFQLNPMMPNDPYSGRTAPLNSKRCI